MISTTSPANQIEGGKITGKVGDDRQNCWENNLEDSLKDNQEEKVEDILEESPESNFVFDTPNQIEGGKEAGKAEDDRQNCWENDIQNSLKDNLEDNQEENLESNFIFDTPDKIEDGKTRGKAEDDQQNCWENDMQNSLKDNLEDNQEENLENNFIFDTPNFERIPVSQCPNGSNSHFLFKRMTQFFADRKFITFVSIHLVITLVIFSHFAMEKHHVQKSKVPENAPRYSWKIAVPTFEFGTMHAILLQLGVLPLTMCRLVISKASATFLNTIIPFNETLKYHIAIGYTLVFMLFITIIVFFIFFGLNCADGDQTFCSKFTSEIMITGYVIFGLFLVVAITSYLRTIIPYRLFYVIHHLVFITYAVTIAHTIDNVQRNKGGRSQTFKWFTASILLYITDRATMFLNERYESRITNGSKVVKSTDGKKMIILEVYKPDLFYFYPGQYVYLKVPSLDDFWHPFSIASSPDSTKLAFYIEVFGESSWTRRLFEKLCTTAKNGKDADWTFREFDVAGKKNEIQIMGPYGTSLGNTKNYSHALVIGTGTGIVPILSLLHSHVDQLLSLDTGRRIEEQKKHHAIVARLQKEKEERGGSFLDRLLSTSVDNSLKPTTAQQRRGLYWHIYKYILMFFGTLIGVTVVGITISWNSLSFELYGTMKAILYTGTLTFQSSFLLLTLTVQDMSGMWFMVDVVFIILGVLADVIFFARDLWGRFSSMDLFIFTVLSGYKVLRYWTTLLRLEYNPIHSAHKRHNGIHILDNLHLVWTLRSTTLISQMLPDLELIWNSLVYKFGEDFASKVCKISIYCTSKDEDACSHLHNEVLNSNLYKMGALKFNRPSFPLILEQHTSSRMADSSLKVSRTLLAFCGSPRLAHQIKEIKIMNDLAMFIAGVDRHRMDLVVESFGGTKPGNEKNPTYDTRPTFPVMPLLADDGNANTWTSIEKNKMGLI